MSNDVLDIEYIKEQLKNGYIDISEGYPDNTNFNFVKKAVELYEKYITMQKNGTKNIALVDIDTFFREEFISKQKIRDKIKLFKLKIETLKTLYPKTYTRDSDYLIYVCKIQVLKEILGE